MVAIPSAQVKKKWTQTVETARTTPVVVTEDGRELIAMIEVELARRALQSLEDAEDAVAVARAQAAVAAGQQTVSLREIAHALGVALD